MNNNSKVAFNSSMSISILNAISAGIIAADKHSKILICNANTKAVLGYSAEDLQGGYLAEYENLKELKDLLWITVETGSQQVRKEIIVRHKEGKKILLGCTTSLLKDDAGGINGVCAIFRDISGIEDKKRQQRRLEKLALIGESTAGIAHELKNPLAIISGIAQNLDRIYSKHPEKMKEYTQKIIDEIDRIESIIEDVMTVTRSGDMEFDTFAVKPVIDRVVSNIRMNIKSQECVLKKDIKFDEYFMIKGVSGLFEQLLVNLINNALEAVNPESGEIKVEAKMNNGSLLVMICDNGPGIEKELINKIYDPFFTTKKGGTGLGLSICRKIINIHNGRLQIKSSEKGTDILFQIPIGK